MTLKVVEKNKVIEDNTGDKEKKKEKAGEKEYAHVFDTEYVKKMLKFYKSVNEQEQAIGVYISSTDLNKDAMVIVQYFTELFLSKTIKSPLEKPTILLFDPLLQNNKLDIKVRIHIIIITYFMWGNI